MGNKTLRTCRNGHRYYKSSDCNTCPICENERKPQDNFMDSLAAPARRALESIGVSNLEQLSQFTETEILKLHGMGKHAIAQLKNALKQASLKFKQIQFFNNQLNN